MEGNYTIWKNKSGFDSEFTQCYMDINTKFLQLDHVCRETGETLEFEVSEWTQRKRCIEGKDLGHTLRLVEYEENFRLFIKEETTPATVMKPLRKRRA